MSRVEDDTVLRLLFPDWRMKKFLRLLLVLLGCIALSFYFIHNAIKGKYGLEAQTRLIERSIELDDEIKSLGAVQAQLQRHVDLLAVEPPAHDLVEEIARRDLGYAYNGEAIIYYRNSAF